ncbi:unnamed protein product [Blepharisma stoltei]|uniref:Bromo domain-containing protein n=1 Tax=Blepharisma stoltei TaxID=1481888 RepID=A0AAU9JHW4_9CILI|nr:unnamed protein product [Blepharisma stoltei]
MSIKRSGISRDESLRAFCLINYLIEQPESLEFQNPVDYKALRLEDYPAIIRNPMDLNTIKKKLKLSQYQGLSEVLADLSLIWNNCRTYNTSDTFVYCQAEVMERHMTRYCNQHGIPYDFSIKRPTIDSEAKVSDLQEKIDLSMRIKYVNHKTLAQIVELIEKECPHIIQRLAEEKIQLRFDAIDKITLRKIAKLTYEEIGEEENCSGPIKKLKTN